MPAPLKSAAINSADAVFASTVPYLFPTFTARLIRRGERLPTRDMKFYHTGPHTFDDRAISILSSKAGAEEHLQDKIRWVAQSCLHPIDRLHLTQCYPYELIHLRS
ncbi:hypothetical protein BCON_0090g00230 [Botryotinia convoluta]|uniref:Uncharacterized protein n=1 Tax=Botryotinia convoluta TaxID=54673 RepID=A0A4Z1I1R4_9HELO|nr:hypothetical protein BCON_0090g00230 [Botryotinia convoluta]